MTISDEEETLRFYLTDYTPFFAAACEPRVSWCAYVPRTYSPETAAEHALVVLVHGTDRRAEGYRDRFAQFAERHGCIVLAPLFPAGLTQPFELDNYKWLRDGDFRFDEILLGIVDEVRALFRLDASRFLMHGFSGGGHFVHRFLYLYPERLLAASIGAPGVVTLLDDRWDWWVGTRNLPDLFGAPVNREALANVAVQTVVGGDDTETWEITLRPGDAKYMPGADLAGQTRIDRINALATSLERSGVRVRRTTVPGVGHDGFAVLNEVQEFFADALDGRLP